MMMRYILIILLAWMPGATSLYAASYDELMREAQKEYSEKHYDKALTLWEKAAQQRRDPAALANQAAACYRLGKLKEAQDLYSQAAALAKSLPSRSSETAAALYNAGTAALAAQEYDDAIELLRNSLRAQPGNPDAKYNLSYALMKKKNDEKKQEQQNKQNQQNKQDQNKQDQQNKEDQNKQDQQSKQDQNKQDQNRQDQQSKQDKQSKQEQQKKPTPQISRREAEQMLEAVDTKERAVRRRLMEIQPKKKQQQPNTPVKNW